MANKRRYHKSRPLRGGFLPIVLLCLLLGCNVSEISPPPSPLPTPVAAPLPSLPSSPTPSPSSAVSLTPAPSPSPVLPSRADIEEIYGSRVPELWGEARPGILSRLDTGEKIIALTFDACGWGKVSGYDEALVSYLIEENIPATLFISGKWIEDNPDRLLFLASQENFEIENHGYHHKPLSVSGRSQYGIRGTASAGEVYDEIFDNAQRMFDLTGRMPRFFRTGTAYYDDVAVDIAAALGETVAGFSVAGDAGATRTKAQIMAVCENVQSGDILLFHMNRPNSETAAGVAAAIPALRERGFSFVKLEDF